MKIILIMGLPGSGKTTLASELVPLLKAKWLNADEVRKEANDWDFSAEGELDRRKECGQKQKNLKIKAIMLLQTLFVQHLLQELFFQQILLYG